MSLKCKRIVAMLFCITTVGTFGAISAFAANSGVVSSTNIDVSIDGYVEFLEGPLLFEDKVFYTALLSGSDIDLVYNSTDTRCYVQPKTDKKTLAIQYLNSNRQSVINSNGTKCGHGGSYAKLLMSAAGTTSTITD